MPNYFNGEQSPTKKSFSSSSSKSHEHSLIWHCCRSSFSYCPQCSTLFLTNAETQFKVTAIKPTSFFLPQEFDLNTFDSTSLTSTYTFQNKKAYLKLRQTIIKDMKSLQSKYGLSYQTFFLALHYLDNLCSNFCIFSFNEILQIAKFCLVLAAKFNEQGQKAFEIESKLKNKISENYKKDEMYVLQLLNYNLNVITCYDYALMIMNFGFLYEGEIFSKKKMNIVYNQLGKMIYAFCESKKYIEMSPKQIALGIIGFARESIGLSPFNDLLQIVFNFYDKENSMLMQQGLEKVKVCLKIKKTTSQIITNENNKNCHLNSPQRKIDCEQLQKQIEDGFLRNKMIMYAI